MKKNATIELDALINKGAIKIYNGDWEVVYALNGLFYEFDKDFKTLNRIMTPAYAPSMQRNLEYTMQRRQFGLTTLPPQSIP